MTMSAQKNADSDDRIKHIVSYKAYLFAWLEPELLTFRTFDVRIIGDLLYLSMYLCTVVGKLVRLYIYQTKKFIKKSYFITLAQFICKICYNITFELQLDNLAVTDYKTEIYGLRIKYEMNMFGYVNTYFAVLTFGLQGLFQYSLDTEWI